jgi:hypothetical protein
MSVEQRGYYWRDGIHKCHRGHVSEYKKPCRECVRLGAAAKKLLPGLSLSYLGGNVRIEHLPEIKKLGPYPTSEWTGTEWVRKFAGRVVDLFDPKVEEWQQRVDSITDSDSFYRGCLEHFIQSMSGEL